MGSLIARLGLETARIPHADRHGIIWLSRGELFTESGCLAFKTASFDTYPPGVYQLPHQTVSAILLGPGTSLTHDAMRIASRHGTCLIAVGEGGVRLYTSLRCRTKNVCLLVPKAK